MNLNLHQFKTKSFVYCCKVPTQFERKNGDAFHKWRHIESLKRLTAPEKVVPILIQKCLLFIICNKVCYHEFMKVFFSMFSIYFWAWKSLNFPKASKIPFTNVFQRVLFLSFIIDYGTLQLISLYLFFVYTFLIPNPTDFLEFLTSWCFDVRRFIPSTP